ncbi:MAG TPA: AmmeMemoRadiSam system protein B [Burkholderiaceae bacterium]
MRVRPAAVAGLFYPAEASALREQVEEFLGSCAEPSSTVPKLVIVPHAGYVYSGAVAACAYALVAPRRGTITRVVLLGPAHHVGVRALAAPEADAFETPLGRVPLDRTVLAALDGLPQLVLDDRPHAREHSLEVQLPFLQVALGAFALVPFVAGAAEAAEVAQLLERLWGGDETVIVVSSDMSHYLPYDRAREIDRATAARILALDAALDPDQACGAAPVNGALLAARAHGLCPRLLALRNSGDVTGDRRRVVGYGAFAFEART